MCPSCGRGCAASELTCPSCDAARPRGGWALHPYVGDLVGERHRILRGIGRGTSGEVFLAADQRIPDEAANRVVVKILARVASDSVQRRFMNEVRAARRAKSRHCVTVYDAGTHRGASYLVMEHLAGQTLKDRVQKGGPLPVQAAITLGEQVADALEDVHAAGVVHRDVKPENLMILSESPLFVKLLDFGIAHLADDGETLSAVGTPRYMAPEQILHRPVDARTDIYALGICLYELLAQKPPFQAESIEALLQAKLNETPAPLATHCPNVPEHIASLVDQMIQREPSSRPRTMHDVAMRLRTVAPPLNEAPAKKAGVAMLVVGLAMVVAIATAIAASGKPRASGVPSQSISVLPAPIVEPPRSNEPPVVPAEVPAASVPLQVAPPQALARAASGPTNTSRTTKTARPVNDVVDSRPSGGVSSPAPSSSVIFRSGELRRDEL